MLVVIVWSFELGEQAVCCKALGGVCLLCCGALSYESGDQTAVISLQVCATICLGVQARFWWVLKLCRWRCLAEGARYAAVLQETLSSIYSGALYVDNVTAMLELG